MAVSQDEVFRNQYEGNGVATTFAITFEAPKDSLGNMLFIKAVRTDMTETGEEDTTLEDGVHYNIIGTDLETVGDPIPEGSRITIYREMDFLQQVSFSTLSTLDPRTLEDALDKLTFIAQQLQNAADRSITVPISDEAGSLELPPKNTRANLVFGFGENGEPIAAEIVEAIGVVSSYFKTLVDAGSLADLQGRLEIDPAENLARLISKDVFGEDAVILRGLEASKGVGNSLDISAGVVAAKVFEEDYYMISVVPAVENWDPGTAITDDTTRNYVKIRLTPEGFTRRVDQAPDVDSDVYLASFISVSGDFPAVFSTAERGTENLIVGSRQRLDLGISSATESYVLLALKEDLPTSIVSSSGTFYGKGTTATGDGVQFTATYSASRESSGDFSVSVDSVFSGDTGFRIVELMYDGANYIALEINESLEYRLIWEGEVNRGAVDRDVVIPRFVPDTEVASVAFLEFNRGGGLTLNGEKYPSLKDFFNTSRILVASSDASYAIPAGDYVLIAAVGGGGGGGGARHRVSDRLGGGGGGAATAFTFLKKIPGVDTLDIVVGGRGNRGGNDSSGAAGGDTSVTYNSVVIAEAPGGSGGSRRNNSLREGAIATVGDILIQGSSTGADGSEASKGGGSYFGQGGSGGNAEQKNSGNGGQYPGGGGGGGCITAGSADAPVVGGSGMAGCVYIWVI